VTFSVVVVLHESAAHLAKLLDSIDRHSPSARRSSPWTPGRATAVRTWPAERGCEVVALDGNPGFGAANNAGLERARHDVTALLNPDVQLLDAGLLRLVDRARATDALHVPRLLNLDGSVQDSAHPRPGSATEVARALLPARLAPQHYAGETTRAVGWAIAAALVARTATLRRLGPFDPDAHLFYEDLDLCLRARPPCPRSCTPTSGCSTRAGTRPAPTAWRPRPAGGARSSATGSARALGRSTTSPRPSRSRAPR
jgi:GT2 family glycosyltransferase